MPEAITLLERTPPTLRALLSGLPDVWVNATEGPDTWSPTTIVAHLLSTEETNWIVRARAILEAPDDSTTLPPFDRNAHLHVTGDRSLANVLGAFSRARAKSVATLTGWRLTGAQLARTGLHPEFGTVTLEQLLATWVAHDLDHLGQIARVMASQYRHEVGPWRAFLPILA